MKQCEEYELAISCYVDGELKSPGRSELFRHLGECESCRTFLESSMRIRTETTREKRYEFITLSSPIAERLDKPRTSTFRRLIELTGKRVAVPLPVAAVGLTLLIVAGALLLRPQQTAEMVRTEKAAQAQTVMSMPAIVISQ